MNIGNLSYGYGDSGHHRIHFEEFGEMSYTSYFKSQLHSPLDYEDSLLQKEIGQI